MLESGDRIWFKTFSWHLKLNILEYFLLDLRCLSHQPIWLHIPLRISLKKKRLIWHHSYRIVFILWLAHISFYELKLLIILLEFSFCRKVSVRREVEIYVCQSDSELPAFTSSVEGMENYSRVRSRSQKLFDKSDQQEKAEGWKLRVEPYSDCLYLAVESRKRKVIGWIWLKSAT